MGSPCEVLCETPRRALAVELTSLIAAEAWRIEDKFSRYMEGTIVDRINRANGRPVDVDEETAGLIDFANTLCELSDRRFDITSGVLRTVWQFDGSDAIPTQASIDAVLAKIGWHRAEWRPPTLLLPAGMEIDLGGIGKEYAVDRCAAIAKEQGGPPCLVNFGGDLAASAPARQRRAWRVAIEGSTPDSVGSLLDLKSGAIATSGDARRYLEKDGIRYSHILDPITGWPVRGAPHSITVAAPSCTQAGMLSTMAMLKGPEAENFLEREKARYWSRR